MIVISLLVFTLLIISANAFESSDEKDAQKYLADFYDFDKSTDNIKDALKDMQKFAGIKADGKLSAEVISHMNKARCGVKDKDKKKLKRYVLSGQKWDSGQTYSYYLHTDWMPRTMSEQEVRRGLRVGLEYWQRAAKIGFRESQNKAECKFSLSFGGRGHLIYDVENNFKPKVDPFPLDNVPSGVLAHAFFPRNGNLHYDNAETWTEGKNEGVNLRIVTAHEMGHAIGLHHSQDPTALMAPWYSGYVSEAQYKLPDDDTRGVQSIYGASGKRLLPKMKRELGKNQARLCNVKNLKSIFTLSDGKIYVVAEDNHVFRLDGTKVDEKFEPVSLPSGLNNADSLFYDSENQQLVIFKGDKVFSASGSDVKNLKMKELKIGGKGMYQGRSSAAFARYAASEEGSQYFWIVQDNELISGVASSEKMLFSRRSRKLDDVFQMSNNAKFPPSIDAAFAAKIGNSTELYLFVGNSYYVGIPAGIKQFKYLIPAEYPKTFKTFLQC